MARPKLGEKAMTAAERKRRSRAAKGERGTGKRLVTINLQEFAEANGFGRINDGVTDCTPAFAAAVAAIAKGEADPVRITTFEFRQGKVPTAPGSLLKP